MIYYLIWCNGSSRVMKLYIFSTKLPDCSSSSRVWNPVFMEQQQQLDRLQVPPFSFTTLRVKYNVRKQSKTSWFVAWFTYFTSVQPTGGWSLSPRIYTTTYITKIKRNQRPSSYSHSSVRLRQQNCLVKFRKRVIYVTYTQDTNSSLPLVDFAALLSADFLLCGGNTYYNH